MLELPYLMKTFQTFFSNIISNRTKTFTDHDPSWMTEDIKNKAKLKNKFYQYMGHQMQTSSLLKEENLRNKINNLIMKSKEKSYQCIKTKLNDLSLSDKTYWSILKTFYKGKKVLTILLLINNKIVTDFQEKGNIFSFFFFAKKCLSIPSSSVLPVNISYMTKNRFETLCFCKSDVTKLTKTLDVSKSHGQDDSRTLILQKSLTVGIFVNGWNTANILNKILIKFEAGLNSEKWLLIWSKQNTLKKSFFQNNLGNLFILIPTLIIFWLKKCKPKSIQCLN